MEMEEREKYVLKWKKLFLFLLHSGLLDIQFYFSVLKFTLENEISIVIESRIFVFRTYTHNMYSLSIGESIEFY